MGLVPDNRKIALVTDATSGIGPALVKNLCVTLKGIIYMTTSSKKAGDSLLETFQKEGFCPRLRILDLAGQEIKNFVQYLNKEHGGLDILVANNQAEYPKSSTVSYPEAEALLKTNVYNQIDLIHNVLPIMKAHGRIVLSTPQPGVHYAREILREKKHQAKEALGGEDITVEQLKAGVEGYLQSITDGSPWTDQPGIICTMAQFALARNVTRKLVVAEDSRSLLINVGSPGWVLTADGKTYLDEKGNHLGEKGVDHERGAADILWLAKLPRGVRDPSCQVVKNRRIMKWQQ